MSAAAALVAVLQPLSDATAVRYSVSYQLREDSTLEPLSALQSPIKAVFTFELSSDPSLYTTMVIPIDETWLRTDGPLAGFAIDLSNSEVAAFTDEITFGGWVDPFGVDIGIVASAFKSEAQ